MAETEVKYKFALGQVVRDRITGHEGRVTSICDFLTGCTIYGVDARLDVGGIAKEDIDETRLEAVADSTEKYEAPDFLFLNGDKVVDTLTGFRGTVTSRLAQVSGDNRYGVTTLLNTGKPESPAFDEMRLKKLPDQPATLPEGRKTGGGDMPRRTSMRLA